MIRSGDMTSYQPVQVRRMMAPDVPAIVAIERQLFVDPWEQAVFLEALTYFPTTCFVATCDGAVAGFIIGALEDTGENVYGHICNFAVDPAFQNRGIGRLLVQRAEHQFAFELASAVQLEVRLSNVPAQKFYRRLGYREVFRIAAYYSNHEDAVVMMRWFRF